MRNIYIKEKHARYTKKYRHLRITSLKDRFGSKCALCGYDKNYACLDFHHTRDKRFKINTVSITKPLEIVDREVEKCVLLCRNCHSDIHSPSLSRYPNETMEKINKLPSLNTEYKKTKDLFYI